MVFPKGKMMNDLILSKMHTGEWGEVVRLMREEYGPALGAERREERRDMPFQERPKPYSHFCRFAFCSFNCTTFHLLLKS